MSESDGAVGVPGHSTVVFAGGGTGGHLFPGIAVAEELRAIDPQTEILFAGSNRSVEQQIVASSGYEHRPLPVESSAGFRRRPLRSAWNLWQSYAHARKMLRNRRPNCVVGLGGFASVPVALAARRMGLPLVLLEQNVVPGRATTWLSRFASCVCLSFAETTGTVGRCPNAVFTGNPVRQNVAALCRDERNSSLDSRRTLLVLGGSQGASAINDAMLAAVRSLQPCLGAWRIIHQTGKADVDRVRSTYAQLGIDATVEAFFDDLVPRYRQATLVISRAGATTLAELACSGCPSLLVPYPNSLGDHQFANARWFEARGAAEIVEEADRCETTSARLVEKLSSLAADTRRRDAMAKAMRTAARPHAARDVAECVRRQFR